MSCDSCEDGCLSVKDWRIAELLPSDDEGPPIFSGASPFSDLKKPIV